MDEAASLRGQFNGFDSTLRDERVLQLIEIINRHVHFGVASIIDTKQHELIFKGKIAKLWTHLHTMRAMMQFIGLWFICTITD